MFVLCNYKFQLEVTGLVVVGIFFKFINFVCLGLFVSIFSTPDTYKSINVAVEYLMVNCIVYEYSFMRIAKYLSIQLLTPILAAFLTIGIYYELFKSVPTSLILSNILPTSGLYVGFNYSMILATSLMHIGLCVGLTILTNSTNSINAFNRSIQKTFLLYFASLIFGTIIDPIGYMWPNLVLYSAVVITRNEYSIYNVDMLIVAVSTLIAILFFYPLGAIYVKFVLRTKYLKYVEY